MKLDELFLDTLRDIYFAERQILKALPKMTKAAKTCASRRAHVLYLCGQYPAA